MAKGICQASMFSWFVAICVFSSVVIMYTQFSVIATKFKMLDNKSWTITSVSSEKRSSFSKASFKVVSIRNTSNKTNAVGRGKLGAGKPVEKKNIPNMSMYKIRQDNLHRSLKAKASKLLSWQPNITRTREVRNNLNQINGSFVFTQINTPVGGKYYNSFHQDPVTIDDDKHRLLLEASPFAHTSIPLFNTCAVVGNGGILRRSNCGKEIDASDFVFRANLQPIKHFTRDAGRKTNLTSLNPSKVKNRYDLLSSKANITKIVSAFKEYTGYILWIPNSQAIATELGFIVARVLKENTTLQLLLADDDYFSRVGDYWKSSKMLSTGMILTSIALSLCDEVRLYGFWPFSVDLTGKLSPMHYTNDITWSSYTNAHDFPHEFQQLTELHSEGVLRLQVSACVV
ncbi:alpha-N-acetylneuraminide alpha-2,8-sialyltransferase-like [Saccoglossus kowalevskii]|uniref:Alpha-N-acetylneuraminide alpha-2,8-sialyltransferase-like n=1 Tax=Saccoglossus kowalevskii TaxID=10224 RepID=A0ABM0MBK2_SACKO|nr:PREDICTED: alpha-N-acetylneuraminide alpha-2,8-sialyltransferase-like [Saccoglossus kowalevskii]